VGELVRKKVRVCQLMVFIREGFFADAILRRLAMLET